MPDLVRTGIFFLICQNLSIRIRCYFSKLQLRLEISPHSSYPQMKFNGKEKAKSFHLFIFSNLEYVSKLILHSGYQLFFSLTCIIFPYTHFFQDHIWSTNNLTGNLFCKYFIFNLCGMNNRFHII